jgi:hypothetical protein
LTHALHAIELTRHLAVEPDPLETRRSGHGSKAKHQTIDQRSRQ